MPDPTISREGHRENDCFVKLGLKKKALLALLFMGGLTFSSLTYFSTIFSISDVKTFEIEPSQSIAPHESQASSTQECKLMIGVLSKPDDSSRRDAIRHTWARNVQPSNITSETAITFVVGSSQVEIPHVMLQLGREIAVSNDITILNVSDESEYSSSIEWFSWAAHNTKCEFYFKSRDSSYIRVQSLLRYLQTSFGVNPWKKCFGAALLEYPGEQLYMSSAGYGITRDVAVWIAENKQSFKALNHSVEGVAIGNLLATYRNFSGLLCSRESHVFGPNCTHRTTVLDSPEFSNGFNVYVRYHDEITGDFCAHFEKNMGLVEHKLDAKGFISFEPVVLSRLDVLDDTVAPWNRSNRWRYTQDRDWFHSRKAYTFHNWLALRPMGVYGGDAVFNKFIPAEKSLHTVAVTRAKGVAAHIMPCHTKKIIGTWLKTWGDRREYIVHIQCRAVGERAMLIHVPFRPDGHIEIYSPAYIVGKNRIVVIVPITCRLDRLSNFLNTSGQELRSIRGRKRKIILAWSYCKEKASNFSESEINAVADDFQRTSPSAEIEMQLLFFEDGTTFSRSRALNRAFKACDATDIAVILDVDVFVRADFYLNCLAFARPGHSMYFPIMFSRYNPEYIAMYAKAGASKFGGLAFLGRPEAITVDTGIWREFSLGMVALCVQDAKSIGFFDDTIQGCGTEDVDFFERAYEAGYINWRMYEPNEIHLYHPKDCSGLVGDTGRYQMCLDAKLRMEGNQPQLAYALHEMKKHLIKVESNSNRKR
jgi:hypothetical protein